MSDDSFSLSKAYFAALQTLRKASNMVDDVLQDWGYLHREWDSRVPGSGVFSDEDLSVVTQNWATATAVLETRAQRVHARIARKTEDIKSLRDGVHTHQTRSCCRLSLLTLTDPSYSTRHHYERHQKELP